MGSQSDVVRVISLTPSGTEIVYALGLGDTLVGVSHACDYPGEVERVPRVTSRHDRSRVSDGSTKPRFDLDVERVSMLRPTVVLTQNVCDVCTISGDTVGRALSVLDAPPRVVELQGNSTDDLLTSIRQIGTACGAEAVAETLVSSIRLRLTAATVTEVSGDRPRVLCLEWLTPFMVAGLWIPDLIAAAGGLPIGAASGVRSRRIAAADLAQTHPNIVIGMPCALDMTATITALRRVDVAALFPRTKIYAFDGRVPSRHGPRLADVQEAIAEIVRGQPGKWNGLLYCENPAISD
jgi:iron complex transport system substrate-binding protein